MAYTRAAFIAKVGPMAQTDAKTSKILASLTIAQAILESGDGNSTLTVQGNALFGIKATGSWRGKVWTGKTIEYYNPKTPTTITAGFRSYNNWEESIEDHSKLLTSASRYAKVVGETDYKKACNAIAAAGYATDPQYAQKLINLIEKNNLTQFDKPIIKDDPELSHAVSTLINKGININFNNWKRLDLINLNNVPSLLMKLGGIDKLVDKRVIANHYLWRNKQYTKENVRSLLIKAANML